MSHKHQFPGGPEFSCCQAFPGGPERLVALQSAASYGSLFGLKMGHPLAERFLFFGGGGWVLTLNKTFSKLTMKKKMELFNENTPFEMTV